MDITFQYTKLRATYGRQALFCEAGPALCDSVPPDVAARDAFMLRNPVHAALQHAPVYWHQHVNTIRAEYANSGCNHMEGGWPRDVQVTDPETTQRYRRKVEKDDGYIHCVMSLSPGMESLVLQNNAIDMYQTYYTELAALPAVERTSCRTVNVYRDSAGRRPVTSVCWRPDGAGLLAVAYADLDAERGLRASAACYLWDVDNATTPEATLLPPEGDALLELQYNPRHAGLLAGALLSGRVALWDARAGPRPTALCPPHVAHRDLARALRYINAKSGAEFFSSGPDGACKWWDARYFTEPTDEIVVDLLATGDEQPSVARAYGVSCLEFEPTIPTRFMVGTENGLVVSGNRKGKTAADKLPSKFSAHAGPVWRVERNPGFLKNFVTVGAWGARVWSEECRESAVLWTPPQRRAVCDAAWSPARLSLLLLALAGGQLALWDLLRRQHQPVLSVQVCADPLSRIAAHDSGTLVACGSSKGNIYLLELSRSLTETSKHDKTLLTAILDRESKRERILEARLREIRLKARTAEEHSPAASVTEVDATLGDRDLAEATAEFHLVAKRELAAI